MSKSLFKSSELGLLGKIIIRIAGALRLLSVTENTGEDKQYMEINNMTLINLLIKFIGPVHERTLTIYMMGIQVCFC